jgi:glycolate oxidase
LTKPPAASRQSEVARALREFLPARAVLFDEEDTRPYECDGLTAYRQLPMVVALPETEEQVRRILEACAAMKVPVVPRGAGTGLSGGALPPGDGVLLSMAKFMRVLRVDARARTAVVQPGVRNAAISEAAAPLGLYYAPDPSSQIACTIGGNVAENSGGVHCLKYGLTVHNVLRLRGFTASGEAVELGSQAPDAPGYDLLALAIGSEGMLVVVTEVTVKLLPKPQCAKVVMASFDDVEKAGQAVADVIAAGIIPAGLEMMDRPATHAVEQFVGAGYDLDAAAILLCESDGTPEEVEDEIGRMRAVLARAGATRMSVSRDEAERLRFWSGRKAAFPAAGRISPDYYCMDGTIPRKRLGEVLKFIGAMEKKYGLRCPNVFHAGDGNLHPLILFDANDADQLHRTELFAAEVLEKCVEVGGTITGEHGVGVEKINQMCVQFRPDELELFLAVKRAFDPAMLLNPERPFRRSRAARSTDACACAAAGCRIRSCRAFESRGASGAYPGSRRAQGAAAAARRRQQGLLRQRAARRASRHARLRGNREL